MTNKEKVVLVKFGFTRREEEEKDKRRAGILPVGATALGAGALATAYGLGSDKQIQDVLRIAKDYNPDAYRSAKIPGALPPNTSELQYYQKILTPAAQLTPFGKPVGSLLSAIRTSPQLMGRVPIVDLKKLSEGEGVSSDIAKRLNKTPIGEFLQSGFGTAPYMLASPKQKETAGLTIEKNLKELEKLKGLDSNPDIEDKIKALLEENEYFNMFKKAPNSAGGGGAQHYAMFARGAVPSYMHMMKAHHKNRLVPAELLEKINDPQKGSPVKYSDWMARKLEEYTSKTTGDTINPYEFSLDFMDNDKQVKFMQDFHASLDPEVQKYRLATEDLPDERYVSQTKNYLPKGVAFANVRNKLKDFGIIAGSSGLGGLAGHSLYKALTEDDEESTLGASLSSAAGMGLGGVAGYLSRTEEGKRQINNLISKITSRMNS